MIRIQRIIDEEDGIDIIPSGSPSRRYGWQPCGCRPSAVYKGDSQETRYGVNEGLELVEQDNGAKGKRYVVEDADGNELFAIPLRGCLLDTRFRNGQLRFREQNSKREGFIDRQGMVVFTEDNQECGSGSTTGSRRRC